MKPIKRKQSKEEKIKALLELSQNKTTIDSLVKTTYQMWRLKKDGLYYGPKGLILNEAQFAAHKELGVKKVLIVRQPNRERYNEVA